MPQNTPEVALSTLLLYSRTLEKERDACHHEVFTSSNRLKGFSTTLGSPEAGGEGSTSIAVQEVDWEAFEGVSIRHRSSYCVLELLVATGDAGAALQLVG